LKSPDFQSLDGKVALVTGAGKRVGKAIALELARAGADVAVHYGSSQVEAEATACEIASLGGRSVALQADLSEPAHIDQLFDRIERDLGGADILVNSAALFEKAPLEELDRSKWERMIQVNLTAPFLCCRHAAPSMKAKGEGDIVNICDIGGMAAWKGFTHYNVSKAGLIMLTRALALELAPEIRVNGVAPGTVLFPDDYDPDTKKRIVSRIPMGREGSPQDVVDTVLFLLTGPRYITGQVIAVDGGRSSRDITGG
jgi:pteridine reductase